MADEEPQKGEEIQEESKIISKHDFYFEIPPYRVIDRDDLEDEFFSGDVNAYNSEGGYDTTYHTNWEEVDRYSHPGFYAVLLTCKRNDRYKIHFFAIRNKNVIMKLGQLPSLADIQFAELGKKYAGYLSDDELSEFKKAIDLAASGYGSGSFVYLRRIFERLIKSAYREHKDTLNIEEKDFLAKRMAEKAQILKDHLPSQLLEMKGVYRVLSRGVHELSEQECLTYFPALRLSIELILDQKIEMDAKKEKDLRTMEEIAEIDRKLKKI